MTFSLPLLITPPLPSIQILYLTMLKAFKYVHLETTRLPFNQLSLLLLFFFMPAPGQCLHLDPEESHTAIKWWVGIDKSVGSQCPLSSDRSLDPLAYHATTCKRGDDDVIGHNNTRDILAESSCRHKCSMRIRE